MVLKTCPRCGQDKELNEDNFYPARPRKNHKKAGWQSNCKLCWKVINKEQREKRAKIGSLYEAKDKVVAENEVRMRGGKLYEIKDGELIAVESRKN